MTFSRVVRTNSVLLKVRHLGECLMIALGTVDYCSVFIYVYLLVLSLEMSLSLIAKDC